MLAEPLDEYDPPGRTPCWATALRAVASQFRAGSLRRASVLRRDRARGRRRPSRRASCAADRRGSRRSVQRPGGRSSQPAPRRRPRPRRRVPAMPSMSASCTVVRRPAWRSAARSSAEALPRRGLLSTPSATRSVVALVDNHDDRGAVVVAVRAEGPRGFVLEGLHRRPCTALGDLDLFLAHARARRGS